MSEGNVSTTVPHPPISTWHSATSAAAVGRNFEGGEMLPERLSSSALNAAAQIAMQSAEDRAMASFGDGYHRILEAIGEPGYRSIKALFFGEDGPPANTIPPITVSFELFEAVQNRVNKTKAALERTKEDLHSRNQQFALLQGQYEQLQGAYNMLEMRCDEMERKNTQLHQDIAKQNVMEDQLRQQILRLKTEVGAVEEKMLKRDEEVQVLHQRVAEGLVALSQKETIIANLRRQLGCGGLLKHNTVFGKSGGEGTEYSGELLERIAADVEGRSVESQLRLYNLELEAKVRGVTEEKKYILMRHTMYRKYVQSVTEAYEALCMSKEDAVNSHVCEAIYLATDVGLSVSPEANSFSGLVGGGKGSKSLHDSQGLFFPSSHNVREDGYNKHDKSFADSNACSINSTTEKGAKNPLNDTSLEGKIAFEEQLHGSTCTHKYFSSMHVTSASDSSSREDEMPMSLAPESASSCDSSRYKDTLNLKEHTVRERTPKSRQHSNRNSPRRSWRKVSNPLSSFQRDTRSASPPREKGSQRDRYSNRRSGESSPTSAGKPGAGRHHKQSSQSLARSSLLATRGGEHLGNSMPSSRQGTPQNRSKRFSQKKNVLPGPFPVALPTFEQQFGESNANANCGSFIITASCEQSRSGRLSQRKTESGHAGTFFAQKNVFSLAKKYAELHAALFDLKKLFASLGEKEQAKSVGSAAFNPDENAGSIALQADYIADTVAADTELLLNLLRRLQRVMQNDKQARLGNTLSTSTIQDIIKNSVNAEQPKEKSHLLDLSENKDPKVGRFKRHIAQTSLGCSPPEATTADRRETVINHNAVERPHAPDRRRVSGKQTSTDMCKVSEGLPEAEGSNKSTKSEGFGNNSAPQAGTESGDKGVADANGFRNSTPYSRSNTLGDGENAETGEPSHKAVSQSGENAVLERPFVEGLTAKKKLATGKSDLLSLPGRYRVGRVKPQTHPLSLKERSASQHGLSAGHHIQEKSLQKRGKQQKESPKNYCAKKKAGGLILPKISFGYAGIPGSGEVMQSHTDDVTPLPGVSSPSKKTGDYVTSHVRRAPQRKTWNAAVVRLDCNDMLGFKVEKPSYLPRRFLNIPLLPTSTSQIPYMQGMSPDGCKNFEEPHKLTNDAHLDLVVDTMRCGSYVSANPVPPPHDTSHYFGWLRHLEQNRTVHKNQTEDADKGFAPSANTTQLRTVEATSPPFISVLPSRFCSSSPLMEKREIEQGVANKNSTCLAQQQFHPSDLPFCGSLDKDLCRSRSFFQTKHLFTKNEGAERLVPPVLGLLSEKERIMVHILRRNPVMRRRHYFSRAMLRRSPKRGLNFSLLRNNSRSCRMHALPTTPVGHFLHDSIKLDFTHGRDDRKKSDKTTGLGIGLQRRIDIMSRFYGRAKYAKRLPRDLLFAKRCIFIPLKYGEQKREFVPILIKSLGGHYPQNFWSRN